MCGDEYELEPVRDLVDAIFDCDTCHPIVSLLQGIANLARLLRGSTLCCDAQRKNTQISVKRDLSSLPGLAVGVQIKCKFRGVGRPPTAAVELGALLDAQGPMVDLALHAR
jgi:hypothetical protein